MITLVIAGLVWAVSRSLRTAILFGLTVAFTWLPVAAVKVLVDRPRPDATLLTHPFTPLQTDGSFPPSGHTAYVVASRSRSGSFCEGPGSPGCRWSWAWSPR